MATFFDDFNTSLHSDSFFYQFYAKDINGTLTTVETRDPLMMRVIGQRQELSFYDVKLANKAYCDGNILISNVQKVHLCICDDDDDEEDHDDDDYDDDDRDDDDYDDDDDDDDDDDEDHDDDDYDDDDRDDDDDYDDEDHEDDDDIGADSMGPAGLGPPNLGAQGPIIWLSPQYFVIHNLIFMYYFNKLTQLQLDLHNVIWFLVNSLNWINSFSQFLIM